MKPRPELSRDSVDDLLVDEQGISTTEYLILMILVVIAGFASWAAFGDAVKKKVEPSQNTHQVSPSVIV